MDNATTRADRRNRNLRPQTGALLQAVLAAGGAQAATSVTVNIDASAAKQHPISPLVYGVGMGDATGASVSDLKTLNVPLNREGGNNMTTYNWAANARNLDNDRYFESYPYPSATAGEAGDTFISNNKSVGATSMLTIP